MKTNIKPEEYIRQFRESMNITADEQEFDLALNRIDPMSEKVAKIFGLVHEYQSVVRSKGKDLGVERAVKYLLEIRRELDKI